MSGGSQASGPDGDETRQVSGDRPDASFDAALGAPDVHALGRYVIVEEAGRGGMGRVYRAYDPKLHREVALKFLAVGGADSGDVARVLREAQAMAQLSHPNVVPVYDVEHAGESVFIAMEYVAGQTLRKWMRPGRPWTQVLEVFREAGRGLAAAHAAGIIHRDFKPTNAILGDDGRVRVMDFGLARGLGPDVVVPDSTRSQSGTDSLSEPLTRAGMVMGTPAYMAPEQLEGKDADASTDQYGFCVALFEALYGARPFSGSNRAVQRAKQDKDITIPADSEVPGWVQRIVERGLEPQPAKRWPSMLALLDALESDPTVVRRRRLWAAAVTVTFIGGAAGAVYWAARREPPCAGARARLGDAWGDAQRKAVTDAFAAADLSYSAATSERVVTGLDAYANGWVEGYVDACEATEVRKEQSAELLDARMHCLDGRKDVLAALVTALGEADAAVVRKSVQAVTGLPPVSRCADKQYVMARVRPPDDPETAARVEALRQTLARARALQLAGRYADATGIVDEVSAAAAALDYPPLRVTVALQTGVLRERTGKYEESATAFREAFFDARETGQDEVRVNAAVNLVTVVGDRLAHHARGRAWADHARAEIAVAGQPDDEAELLNNLGLVALAAGELDKALSYHTDALAIREEVFGSDHVQVAVSVNNMAGAKYNLGDYEGAAQGFRRALEIRQGALGPDHPDVAAAYGNVATALTPLGKLDEAQANYERGLKILEAAFGADHPLVATMSHNLGVTFLQRQEFDDAEAHLRRGLEIRRRVLAPDHPLLATSLSTLSAAQMPLGRNEDAIASLEEALAIQTKKLGPEHPDLAVTLNNLGNAYYELKRYDRSLEYHRRNVEVREKAVGPKHPKLALSLANLGRTLDAMGRSAEGIVPLERARSIQDAVGGPPALRGTMYRYLAEALDNGGRRADAIEVIREARALIVEAGASAEELAQLDAWLRERNAVP